MNSSKSECRAISRREIAGYLAPVLLPAVVYGQPSDPWKAEELLSPDAFAQELQEGTHPLVISVAFPVLYRQKHIQSAVFAGPGGKPEGIDLLKKAVSNTPKTNRIVIYCGCCPMVKCPNIRPAYQVLKAAGYTNMRVLKIPTNFHQDWVIKGYPTET